MPRPAPAPSLEQRLRVALAATGVLVYHQDRALRYTWVANPVLGLDEAAILGRTDVELLAPEERQPLVAIKRRVLRSGHGERHRLWVVRDGRRGCFDLIVEPQRDAAGRVVGLVCAAADVTEREQQAEALQQAHLELQRLAGHLQSTLEAERRAIAREVHDELGATLTGLRLQLDALAHARRQGDPALASALAALAAQAQHALQGTRVLVARLRPAGLEEAGLVQACEQALRSWSAACGVVVRRHLARLPAEPDPALALDLFRVLQELLTNVARHAQARRVAVSLSARAGHLRLSVRDDGRGFDPAAASAGFGLVGVRERVARHHGRLHIDSGAQGSHIEILMPWTAGAARRATP